MWQIYKFLCRQKFFFIFNGGFYEWSVLIFSIWSMLWMTLNGFCTFSSLLCRILNKILESASWRDLFEVKFIMTAIDLPPQNNLDNELQNGFFYIIRALLLKWFTIELNSHAVFKFKCLMNESPGKKKLLNVMPWEHVRQKQWIKSSKHNDIMHFSQIDHHTQIYSRRKMINWYFIIFRIKQRVLLFFSSHFYLFFVCGFCLKNIFIRYSTL